MPQEKKPIWFIPEEFPGGHLFMVIFPSRGWIGGYKKYGAGDFMKNYYLEVEDYYIRMGWVVTELSAASAFIAEKMVGQPAWAEDLIAQCVDYSQQAAVLARRNLRLDPIKLSNFQIFKKYQELLPLHTKQHIIGTIVSWTNDVVHEHFSNHVRNILTNAARRAQVNINLPAVFSVLTTPVKSSLAEKEELALLTLSGEFKKDKRLSRLLKTAKSLETFDGQLKKINLKLWRKFHQFWLDYCWLVFVYMGPANTKIYYYSIIQSMLKQKMNLSAMERKIIKSRQETIQEQAKLESKLKLNFEERRLTALARQVVWLKSFRKDILSLILFSYEHLFRELGRRYGLSVKQLWMCFPEEINERFLRRPNVSHTLNDRVRHSLLFYKNGKESFYAGPAAKRILKQLKYQNVAIGEVNELIGSCAYAGKAKGTVKIVNQASDMEKMKPGDILVSLATTPSIVPAMKKAGAIVTNVGGLTCHAAIVSRELKIPCVVGTKIATKVLKDGDRVEVDATRGIVKKLNK